MLLVQREVAAARLARRAGNVELDGIHSRYAHLARHSGEIIDVGGGNAGDERRLVALVFGELHVEEVLEAPGREADGIDHAGLDFRHPWRWISRPVTARDRLGH